MAKYIIDVPDEAVSFMDGEMSFFVEPKIKDERRRHYVLRIDEEDTSIYTESDREAIEDEVWEFASMLMNMHPDVAEDIYWSMNGGKGIGVAAEMTYQEAKSKYETWKKKKEKIRVGDEVKYRDTNGIVVRVDTEDSGVYVVWRDGKTGYASMKYIYGIEAYVTKTGRHFDEMEKLLKKMEVD